MQSVAEEGLVLAPDLKLAASAALGYKNASQRARVLTESWVAEWVRCPKCGSRLIQCNASRHTVGFDCSTCEEQFQLKSKSSDFRPKVLGAEYYTTLKSIRDGKHPSIILLQYDKHKMEVVGVQAIHRACITESCLVARKPLSDKARRAGWTGSYFHLEQVPQVAKVDILRAGAFTKWTTVMA